MTALARPCMAGGERPCSSTTLNPQQRRETPSMAKQPPCPTQRSLGRSSRMPACPSGHSMPSRIVSSLVARPDRARGRPGSGNAPIRRRLADRIPLQAALWRAPRDWRSVPPREHGKTIPGEWVPCSLRSSSTATLTHNQRQSPTSLAALGQRSFTRANPVAAHSHFPQYR
jgi:hypothetical protein